MSKNNNQDGDDKPSQDFQETWEDDFPDTNSFVDPYSSNSTSDFVNETPSEFLDESSDPPSSVMPTIGNKPSHTPTEKHIEIKIGPPLYCLGTCVLAFGQGALAGSIFGFFQGISEGVSSGTIRDPAFPRFLGASTAASGLSLGVWLSAFSGTKCSLTAIRGKKDGFNSFGGGFVAGVVSTLRSRSPSTMIAVGLSSGAAMALIDSLSRFGL